MLRRQFFRSSVALTGLLPGSGLACPLQARAILPQTSPIAGFQHHEGEALRPLLCANQTYLTSSANRPTLTTKKPRASNGGGIRRISPRKFLRQNRLQEHNQKNRKSMTSEEGGS
ncbi:MAG: hypothetical protein ACK4N4_09265 [Burkholderiales bacterium]